MKDAKYHTVGTVPTSNIKFVERGKSMPLTHIYLVTSLAWDRLAGFLMASRFTLKNIYERYQRDNQKL